MNGFIKTGTNITFQKKIYMKTLLAFCSSLSFVLNTYGQESDGFFSDAMANEGRVLVRRRSVDCRCADSIATHYNDAGDMRPVQNFARWGMGLHSLASNIEFGYLYYARCRW